MDIRIIKSPSLGTKELIRKRAGIMDASAFDDVDAVGLIQGKFIDMVCASDIAQKAVGVDVYDVRGLCPQHMTMLAVCGDTASVEGALEEIERKLKEGKYSDYGQTN